MMIKEIIFLLIGIYLIAGFCFALPFVTWGVSRIDEGARNSSVWFRLIIIPGTMIGWPFLLAKWLHAKKSENHD